MDKSDFDDWVGPIRNSVLKDASGKDYASYGFDHAYFAALLDHMGRTVADVDLQAFVLAHFDVLSAYEQAKAFFPRRMTIEQENKALDALGAQANKLAETLADLVLHGQIAPRLVREITDNTALAADREGARLRDVLNDNPHMPFSGLVDLLFDLRVATERAKIKRPPRKGGGTKLPENQLAGLGERFDQAIFNSVVKNGINEDPSERYQRLRAEHAAQANPELHAFAEVFEELWHTFAAFPFTEGRYEPDARQTISRAVDAAEYCLNAFGEQIRRSLIAEKIRQVREARYVQS